MPRTATDPPPLPLPLRPSGDVMRWYGAYAALPEAERPWMGSYAVRAHDPATGTVDVDFFLHGDGNEAAGEGPATRWARSARPGDAVGMFGPSAAFAVQLGRVRPRT
ncbi:siderophore-interacting protein [Streptomyces sp. SJL17-1]|uniref:siderophore-interacting protein n=1 Tax=Streptomyces sp. SJL17-1 TaxID=2967223 RepID=UPI00296763BF|nr:siderophore-interacting protein [Streptomyces sp. SJL17-1]